MSTEFKVTIKNVNNDTAREIARRITDRIRNFVAAWQLAKGAFLLATEEHADKYDEYQLAEAMTHMYTFENMVNVAAVDFHACVSAAAASIEIEDPQGIYSRELNVTELAKLMDNYMEDYNGSAEDIAVANLTFTHHASSFIALSRYLSDKWLGTWMTYFAGKFACHCLSLTSIGRRSLNINWHDLFEAICDSMKVTTKEAATILTDESIDRWDYIREDDSLALDRICGRFNVVHETWHAFLEGSLPMSFLLAMARENKDVICDSLHLSSYVLRYAIERGIENPFAAKYYEGNVSKVIEEGKKSMRPLGWVLYDFLPESQKERPGYSMYKLAEYIWGMHNMMRNNKGDYDSIESKLEAAANPIKNAAYENTKFISKAAEEYKGAQALIKDSSYTYDIVQDCNSKLYGTDEVSYIASILRGDIVCPESYLDYIMDIFPKYLYASGIHGKHTMIGGYVSHDISNVDDPL